MREITAKIKTDTYVYTETDLGEYVGLLTLLHPEAKAMDCIEDLDFSERYVNQKILVDISNKRRSTPLKYAEFVIGKNIGEIQPLEYAFPTSEVVEFAKSVLSEYPCSFEAAA